MNWTGGSLQRTKQANKGVVQKQKAYFARRTHLLNGSNTPAVPFKPDYFQNDDGSDLSGRLLLYRTAQPLYERTQRDKLLRSGTLDSGVSRPHPRERCTPELSRCRASGMGHVKHDVVADRSSKRKVDEADIETRMLEANKKRLLSQRDWIGVAPLRPMHFNFLNNKDKSKIGRRRKVRDSHGAISRQFQPIGDQYTRAVASGVSKDQPDEICIRIGTDALTTAYSTDHNGYNQSQASSDSMLLDQQAHPVEHTAFREAAQPIARGGISPLEYTNHPHERMLRHDVKDVEALVHCRNNSLSSPTAEAHQERTRTGSQRKKQEHIRPTNPSQMEDIPSSEQTASDFQIIQHVQGIDQPLRLVFAYNSPSTEDYAPNAVHSIGQGGTNHAPQEDYAGGARTRDMHQLDDEAERASESEAAGAIAIVDEKPWNSLFNISDDRSSHAGPSSKSGKSFVHAHARLKAREAERNSWSQHATQGDATYISSSTISASLPSLKRATQTRGPIHDREISVELRNTTSIVMDQDERLWRNFVFEGDESHCPATMSARRGESDCILHMGDGVHDAAMLAPTSGSRAFPSLAASAGFVEEFSEEEVDAVDTAGRSAFGGHSVTHTSLVNNTSSESLVPLSRLKTSRSRLGQYHDDREIDSDDGGIDLVDAERLF